MTDEGAAPSREGRAFWWREGLILLGFGLVVAAAIVTVVVPELRREPEDARAGATGAAGEAATAAAPHADAPPAAATAAPAAPTH